MLRQTKNNSRAFTLIEVVVVMAIISIMTGVVIVSFGSGRVQRELETNAREFASIVREAQNYALTGRQAIAGTTPCSFGISWSGANYNISYIYRIGTGACTQTSLVNSYVLKNGVAFGNSGSFNFSLPHASLSFASGSSPAVLTKQSISHIVCTYAEGRIVDRPGSVCP